MSHECAEHYSGYNLRARKRTLFLPTVATNTNQSSDKRRKAAHVAISVASSPAIQLLDMPDSVLEHILCACHTSVTGMWTCSLVCKRLHRLYSRSLHQYLFHCAKECCSIAQYWFCLLGKTGQISPYDSFQCTHWNLIQSFSGTDTVRKFFWQTLLAEHYHSGCGVIRDHELAVNLLEEAACNGYGDAMVKLGLRCINRSCFDEALCHLQQPAAQACTQIHYAMGALLVRTGKFLEAAREFRTGASKGCPWAMHVYGRCLLKVSQKYPALLAKALIMLRLAYQNGQLSVVSTLKTFGIDNIAAVLTTE